MEVGLVSLRRRAVLLGACVVVFIGAALSADARFIPPVSYGSDGTVKVNGRTAFRFHVSNAGLTRAARARLTADRLKPLAAGGWRLITVKRVGSKRAQLCAGDHLICIATRADARASRTSALALARTWAGSLRQLFSLPPITVSPAEITVPENETRLAVVGGVAPGPIDTTASNPKVATSEVHPTRRAVIVHGRSVGRCVVQVSCQGCCATLVVNVKRYAGKLTGTRLVEVTGNPAPARLIEQAAEQAAREAVVLEPGAAATFGRPRLSAASLSSGASTRALVPVKITGWNLIPADLLAPVEVRHRVVAHVPPAGLFYSNDPERITRYGTLFTGKLGGDAKQRLLFHHQNVSGKRVRFVVELLNAGSSPAEVQVVSGVATPIVDTVVVGYHAGMNFMRDYLWDIGRIYRIPPSSKLVVYAADLGHLRTVSGIIDLRQLSGEDLYLRVAADVPARGQLLVGETASIRSDHIPTSLSDHVYTSPTKRLDVNYVVGEQWAFVRLGKYAIAGASDGRQLNGNYGVIYQIKVHLENPTSDRRNVQIVFEPTAGPAGGIFVVGGRIIGVKVVVPPKEFQIASVSLAPGESKDLSIMTMPLAGSAYPAMIVVRA